MRVRSALTCESRRGVCVKCYGRKLATGNTVEIGEAVVSSPHNRSANRNAVDDAEFHVGGTARLEQEQSTAAAMDGTVKFGPGYEGHQEPGG